ncbi:MAG TPA: GAF domain-containing protein, partial [Solirubrobacteraceae bacterium]
ELLSGVLAEADEAGVSDDFYSRLAEGVCRLAGMERAIIFRWDDARRRAHAAGAHGVPLEPFAGRHVTVETAPVARQALVEDRVIEMPADADQGISADFAELAAGRPLTYVPIAAAGRWIGVLLVDPGPDAPPLDRERRDLLWTLGKTLALASASRTATYQRERAHQLEERIDLARDLHEQVAQRLFGISMALSMDGPLEGEAKARCAREVREALSDLRVMLRRPLGRLPRATQSTLAEELARLVTEHGDLGLEVDGGVGPVPEPLEPLAQSVLAEAVRNARKHADPRRVVVRARTSETTFVLEIENDGVAAERGARSGVGLRLAALEALSFDGLLEFGPAGPGRWLVRLAVPIGEGAS